jgi:glycosyltransferase involved in cell wall biosynthesis
MINFIFDWLNAGEMISILIPVYNFDISFLVSCLHQSISQSEIYSEIIIGADGCNNGSIKTYKSLENLEKVKLIISEPNIGRAAIRNRLAESASGRYLLFIDADALIQGNAQPYLNNYINVLNSAKVICGGTAYRTIPPDDPDRYLRWNYGIHREQRSAKKRNKSPHSSFSGFNFIVERELMLKIKFNEELRKYGHEDTLFGYQLRVASIPILHIDNPIVHDGIETNREFILKTQEGVNNLSLLYDMVTDKPTFVRTVKLLRLYRYLRFFGLSYILARIYRKHKRKIEIFLRRRKSTLFIFSLYKLSLFCYYRYGFETD